MRVLITSLNLKHGLNPIVNRLFKPLPWLQPANEDSCEAVFLSLIADREEFVLDEPSLDKLVKRKVPVVIFDHTENWPKDFLLGRSHMESDNQYQPVHSAIAERMTVRAYFKRELPAAGIRAPYPVHPIDWTVPIYRSDGEVDTREQFASRPIDVLMSWGYSSSSRPRLYGELMKQAGRFGAHFALHQEDVVRSLADKRERVFALLFAPWYRRIPMEDILRWQKQTKATISIKGMGLKCFRCGEASYNSLLIQQSPESVQWAYPWVAGQNCIGIPTNPNDGEIDEMGTMEVLWQSLRVHQGSLYDIYLRCIDNHKNYQMDRYSKDYLFPKLIEVLRR